MFAGWIQSPRCWWDYPTLRRRTFTGLLQWPLFFYSGSTPRFPYMCAAYIYLCIHCIIHCIRIWGVKCRLQDDTRGPVEKNAHFCCWIVQESSKSGRLVGMGWYGLSPRTSLHERIWTSEKQEFWKLGTELNQQLREKQTTSIPNYI
jgi:hypothetical protein